MPFCNWFMGWPWCLHIKLWQAYESSGRPSTRTSENHTNTNKIKQWKHSISIRTQAHHNHTLDEGTTSRQFFVSCTGFLSRDVSTSSWHVSFTRLCPARHLRTWLTIYTWFRNVQDVDSARPPTDRVLFHGRTTHLATEALVPPGHVFGTASQYTCATKTSVVTVFGVNSKHFGFNVTSGAQCDIPINCTIQIFLLTN